MEGEKVQGFLHRMEVDHLRKQIRGPAPGLGARKEARRVEPAPPTDPWGGVAAQGPILVKHDASKAREGREPRLEPMFVGGHNHAFVQKAGTKAAPRLPLRTLFTR